MLLAGQVAVIVPTKGRPKQLKMLLKTLSIQSAKPALVIVADGDGAQEALVREFADRLSIIWLNCPTAGQIPQRNYALASLPIGIEAVAYCDDDMQFEANAFERMLAFWNRQPNSPGGVSFNVSNFPAQPSSLVRSFFFMPLEPPGKVTKAGYNTPIVDISTDVIGSQWIIGGATLWRRDVLLTFRLPDIAAPWAVGEDLIFSYKVSKHEPLHVCSDAKARHVDEARAPTPEGAAKKTRAAFIWRAWFVSQHRELSWALFFWMYLGMALGWLGTALFKRDPIAFAMLKGAISGFARVASTGFQEPRIRDALSQ